MKEFEAGFDLGLFADKADLSVTHYRQNSDNVILQIPVAPSTGFFNLVANAASLQNRGWEVSLNVRPITTPGFSWDVGLQWARNRGITTRLSEGLQFYQFPLSGGGNGAGLAVGGVAQVGQPIGAYRGTDYIRCGRGLTSEEGIDIDNTPGQCQGAKSGLSTSVPTAVPRSTWKAPTSWATRTPTGPAHSGPASSSASWRSAACSMSAPVGLPTTAPRAP